MKKWILSAWLLSMSAMASAVPNMWQNAFAQGYSEYSISNEKEQKLWITCNEGGGHDYDHGVWFENGKKTIRNDESNSFPLSFLIDKKHAVAPPIGTKTRLAANDWTSLTQSIYKAKQIDVYVKNKLVGTFKPMAASMKNIRDIKKCQPMFFRTDDY